MSCDNHSFELQLDNGFTTEDGEATIVTFYQGFSADQVADDSSQQSNDSAILLPITTDSAIAFKHKDAELVALAYLDCAVSVLCLAAAVAALYQQQAMEEKTDVNTITIADYTIHVSGLPNSATANEVRVSCSHCWHPHAGHQDKGYIHVAKASAWRLHDTYDTRQQCYSQRHSFQLAMTVQSP